MAHQEMVKTGEKSRVREAGSCCMSPSQGGPVRVASQGGRGERISPTRSPRGSAPMPSFQEDTQAQGVEGLGQGHPLTELVSKQGKSLGFSQLPWNAALGFSISPAHLDFVFLTCLRSLCLLSPASTALDTTVHGLDVWCIPR